jgi:glyoxylase-like metal-dependent hydrolase (beta-lactamase superfamily II)
VGLKVLLHAADKNNEWIQGMPDRLFSAKRLQMGRLEVIHSPGHTAGSVCIVDPLTKILFTGDTLAGTKAGEIRDFRRGSSHDEDVKERTRSVAKLTRETFVSILPFHYSPVLNNAHEKLVQLLASDSPHKEA